jgi:plastocyanin
LRKLIAAVAVAGTLIATAATALAATKTVKVGDNWFVRPRGVPTVTVRSGDTVRFRWTGDRQHNVSATGPARFRSPTQSSGTYSKRVTRRGTYTIICQLHGARDQRMKLRVR